MSSISAYAIMSEMSPGKVEEFYSVTIEKGLFTRKRRAQFYLNNLFMGIDFNGARVLDIGGGSGKFSFYAACKGAREVICLEPEAEGGMAGTITVFESICTRLDLLDRVVLEPVTFQLFESGSARFDVVLVHNSINHLDEDACIQLLDNEHAQDVYKKIFEKIAALSNPGAHLIICDCSRYNFFALLKIRNPFAPEIEWHKHQAPEVWVSMLQEAGFSKPIVRWTSFNQLYTLGKVLTGNRLVSYFLTSHFCLSMIKQID